MNIGHEAPLRVGKLIAVFCSGPCAEISAGITRIAAINRMKAILDAARLRACATPRLTITPPLNLNLEELLCVVFEDHFLFGSAQEIEAFDNVARFVQPLPRFGIFHRSNARPLRAEQAA